MDKFNIKKFLRLFKYIKPNRPVFFIALFLDCLVDISFNLIIPIIMKIMIDAAVQSNMLALEKGLEFTVYITFFGIILLVCIGFFYFRSCEVTKLHFRNNLFEKILKLPSAYIEQNHSGDVLSRLTNDIDTMNKAYGWELHSIITVLMGGIGSIAIMLAMDWKVSLLLISIGIISVLINLKQSLAIKDITRKNQKMLGNFTENLSNVIGGFITIKSLGIDKHIKEKSGRINKELHDLNVTLSKRNALIDAKNFLFSSINFMGVIILAAFLAMQGMNSLGSILSIILLLGNVNRMFGRLNNMMSSLQSYVAGSDRVLEIMNGESEKNNEKLNTLNNTNNYIDINNVSFCYNEGNNVLENINISIAKGQSVALVGPSGSGKSTIIKLLMGFYNISSGYIMVGGKAINNMEFSELRSLIAYVPQDAYIFDGTIKDNISYGRLTATDEEIYAAAKAANTDEFIKDFEKGYDTPVGERGIKLSGGQRQRIAIARAFLKNAPILLLDEATSSLDSYSEKLVQDALLKLMENKTTISVAHRLSTIKNSDMIFLLDKGRVVEQGNHDMLLSQKNLYEKLYKLQFEL